MSQLQTSRIGDTVGIAPRPLSRVPERAAPVPRRRHPYGVEGRMWLGVLVALVLAVAGAAWGASASTRAARSRAQVAALQSQLAGLERRVAADERAAAAQARHLRSVAARAGGAQQSLSRLDWTLQSVPSEAQVANVRNALAAYAACLPQLQREIDGLGLSWRIDPAKPGRDSFKMFSSAPVSGACAAALSGR